MYLMSLPNKETMLSIVMLVFLFPSLSLWLSKDYCHMSTFFIAKKKRGSLHVSRKSKGLKIFKECWWFFFFFFCKIQEKE